MSEYTILVNRENRLSKDYIPDSLVEIYGPTGEKMDEAYINQLQGYVYEEFRKLQKAAKDAGYEIFIDSSYRSYEFQEKIFQKVVQEKGKKYALGHVAPPGGSEHQTGLAFDVIIRRNGKMIEESKDTDPEIVWLFENSYKYGFILRYPRGKELITRYQYERWHYRYVGHELAKELYENNMVLEEYYAKKKEK